MKKHITAMLATMVLVTQIGIPIMGYGETNATDTSIKTEITNETDVEAATTSTVVDPVLQDENDVVLVFDAGHGGSDPGAIGNGHNEKDITLKLAKYAKNHMDSNYGNVTVYLSRSTDTYVGLSARTDYAKSVKADGFISFHMNSASSSAHGAEIWVPNNSYKKAVYEKGQTLGYKIIKALQKLGLTNRGYVSRNSANGSKYPDGSIRDYYAVIAGSKEKGFPGIIIESGFISSSIDVKNYFHTPQKIQKVAIAEADAIAESYELLPKNSSKIPGVTTLTSAELTGVHSQTKITWQPAEHAAQYVIFRKTGANGTYAEVGRSKTTSFVDDSASAGKDYFYTVIARNGSGRANSYDKNGLEVKTPQENVNVTKVVDTGLSRAKVYWDKVADATGYRIYRKLPEDTEWETLYTSKSNSGGYTDQTVEPNTTYDYTVRFYRKVNGKKSWGTADLTGVRVTTDADEITLNPHVINPDNSVTFTWTQQPDVGTINYRLYRKLSGGSYAAVTTTTDLTYTDTKVTAGKTYVYKLRAFRKESNGKVYWTKYTDYQKFKIEYKPEQTVDPQNNTNGDGNTTNQTTQQTSPKGTDATIEEKKEEEPSLTDNETTVTEAAKKAASAQAASYKATGTAAAAFEALQVEGLKVKDYGIKRNRLTWTAVADAQGYQVYRKNAAGSWELKTTIKKASTAWNDNEAEPGVKYSYNVKAYTVIGGTTVYTQLNENGVSISTDTDTFKLSSASQTGFGQVQLKWSGTVGTTSDTQFEIYRKTGDENYTRIATTKSKKYVDDAAVGKYNTSAYTYYIRGVRTTGNKTIASPDSNTKTIRMNGNKVSLDTDVYDRAVPVSKTSLQVNWKPLAGVSGYRVYRIKNGKWARAKTTTDTMFVNTGLAELTKYTYRIRAYKKVNGKTYWGDYTDSFTGATPYSILGSNHVTVQQMVNFYNSRGKKYPASTYKKYGAKDITAFAKIVDEECRKAGVSNEVVFAQICKETGFLQYGGQVKVAQCNFSGIGATDDGAKGADFRDIAEKYYKELGYTGKDEKEAIHNARADAVRIGIRAEVTHLMAYACENVNQLPATAKYVDPRYQYLKYISGTAPFVEWLGQKDNPQGKGWATANNYGYSIVNDYIWPMRNQ
ncbi:MAG: N-acetylmuramoyl-L-alanine amidase [Lachnospiraceae bacterium]|nr:N-acetylmuramoyl-L-alanine amidase [Lachnospiraceae bacterium]